MSRALAVVALFACLQSLTYAPIARAQTPTPVERLDRAGNTIAPGTPLCSRATSPAPGEVVRSSRRPGATIDPCGRIIWDTPEHGPYRMERDGEAQTAARVWIDSMMVYATIFGYPETYSPGGGFHLIAHAERYLLSDGSAWESGAGSASPTQATFDHVETSGDTLRYILTPPSGGLLYQQTDFDSGDHSSQGQINVEGPLVLQAIQGSNTAVLSGRGRIISNDATSYGEPRFNYFHAPVGSIVPFTMTYNLFSGTFSPTTFASAFTYHGTGWVNFVHGVTRPPLTALNIRGPRRIPDQTSIAYHAIAGYEGGVLADVSESATWSIEPAGAGSIAGGVLTVGAIPHSETITVHAGYVEGAVTLDATFTVTAGHDVLATGTDAWPMYQFDSHHTGSLPVTVVPSRIRPLWQKAIGGGYALNPVAAGDGRVFCSLVIYFNPVNQLFALDAKTGDTQWAKGFGSIFSVNPPSFAYGYVYVQTGNHATDTWLHAFDAETGEEAFKTHHEAQWERYFAPTVQDGKVYVNGGYYGGMYGFDAFTGEQLWFANSLPQYDQWTPAIDGDLVYAYVGEYRPALYALHRSDGTPAFSIDDAEFEWDGWSMNLAPVVGGQNDVLAVHDGRMISFDVSGHRKRWQIARSFSGQPSLSGDAIYVVDGGALAVLAEADGATRWTWTPPSGAITENILVTASHVFVSTSGSVYAVNLDTHVADWSSPVSGHLALGNGALYVAGGSGTLSAFDLGLLPPIEAHAGRDTTLECASDHGLGTPVRLDGSLSVGTGLAFHWSADGVTFDDAGSPTPTGHFPTGTSTVTLEVSLAGSSARDTVLVTVTDTAPPTLTLSVEPSLLWPPNHQMVPVHVTASSADACDAAPSVQLVSVACDDPGAGSGPHGDYVAGATTGTADFDFSLRAERSGGSSGRTYTLTYEARDAAGNSVRKSVGVVVPQSRGRAVLALAGSPRLTIFGGLGEKVSKVEPSSIVVGSWDRDWLRASGGSGDESDVDGDGEADRTWMLSAIAGARVPEGAGLFARWSGAGGARSVALGTGVLTSVDGRAVEFSIRALSSPAQGRARFTYTLPAAGRTRLRLFDLGGRVVATLVDGGIEAGTHTAEFVPARSHASQVLFYELEWNGQRQGGRVVLMR